MSAAFSFVDEMRADSVTLDSDVRGAAYLQLVQPPKVHLPLTRGDCVDGPRPCPHATCRYHLGEDTRIGHPPTETCCLDVVDRMQDRANEQARLQEEARDREEAALLGEEIHTAPSVPKKRGRPNGAQEEWGGATLQEIGDILGLTRERVRQIEEAALAKLTGHRWRRNGRSRNGVSRVTELDSQ